LPRSACAGVLIDETVYAAAAILDGAGYSPRSSMIS
jgi:hypothetical protein